MQALFEHPTTRNLIRVFFLQERLKAQGKGSDFKAQHVHVVGAGVMGGDIAAICAMRGLTVTLQDTSAERLAPALKRAATLFEKRVREPRRVRDALDRLIPDVARGGCRARRTSSSRRSSRTSRRSGSCSPKLEACREARARSSRRTPRA
jgi:hypothetical protein